MTTLNDGHLTEMAEASGLKLSSPAAEVYEIRDMAGNIKFCGLRRDATTYLELLTELREDEPAPNRRRRKPAAGNMATTTKGSEKGPFGVFDLVNIFGLPRYRVETKPKPDASPAYREGWEAFHAFATAGLRMGVPPLWLASIQTTHARGRGEFFDGAEAHAAALREAVRALLRNPRLRQMRERARKERANADHHATD